MTRTENKIVLIVRGTRLDDLIARYNTLDQARFYVEHLGVEERLGVRLHEVDEGAHEVLRLSARCADEYPVAPVDVGEDLLLWAEFLRILLTELLEDFLGQLLIHVSSPCSSGGPNLRVAGVRAVAHRNCLWSLSPRRKSTQMGLLVVEFRLPSRYA